MAMESESAALNYPATCKLGRGEKDGSDRLSTILWYNVISGKTCCKEPHNIGRLLTPEKYRVDESKKSILDPSWPRYKRGANKPKPETIRLIESRCRGTKKWIELPLWRVMSKKPPSRKELIQFVAGMKPELARKLAVTNNRKSKNKRGNHLNSPLTIASLWKEGHISALTTLLALQRYAEYSKNDQLHFDAGYAAFHVSLLLFKYYPFCTIREDYFSYLFKTIFSYRYDLFRCSLGDIFKHTVDRSQYLLDLAIRLGPMRGLLSMNPTELGRYAYNLWACGLFRYIPHSKDYINLSLNEAIGLYEDRVKNGLKPAGIPQSIYNYYLVKCWAISKCPSLNLEALKTARWDNID